MNKILSFIKKTPILALCVVCIILYVVLQYAIYFTSEGMWKVDRDGIMHFVLKDGSAAKSRFVTYLNKSWYINEKNKITFNKWIDNNTRYINNRGELIKGRFGDKEDGLDNLYYFDKEGYVLTSGFYTINGKDIYVQEDKIVASDCFFVLPEKNILVYADAKGEIYKNKGLITIGDKMYFIEADGNIPTNQWYSVGADKKYYLDYDGAVVKNVWVDDTYFFDKNGKMSINTTTPDGMRVGKDEKIIFTNKIMDTIEKAEVGDEIIFGKYKYDVKGEKDDLSWILLEKNDEKAFLITKDVIDVQPYNDIYEETTWENSYLRKWLNSKLKMEMLDMNDIQFLDNYTLKNEGNYIYNIGKENDVVDKIFILSKEEHREYYGYADFSTGYNESGSAKPTPYAKSLDVYMGEKGEWYEEYCNYWLRNPGCDMMHNMACMYTGNIDLTGFPNIGTRLGVRPCIVLNYKKQYEESNE